MSQIGNIAGRLFERALWGALYMYRWKMKTVCANLNATQPYCKTKTDCIQTYKAIIRNLSYHVSDILFQFSNYKQLPEDTARYPYILNNVKFEIAPQSEDTLFRMRNGGIFLTAHYGNYEAIGPWLCRLGIPLKASYIPLKPSWLNNIVEHKIRSVDGESYAVNARSPRDFLRLLDEGKLFCLLMDQDSRIPSAAKGSFLGRRVHVNPLPDFLLKHRPATPVYICWMEEPDGIRGKRKVLHAIEVTSKICRSRHKAGMTRECVAGMTREGVAGATEKHETVTTEKGIADTKERSINEKTEVTAGEVFNHWLEERIAENPTLWYGWTHRRFYSCDPEIY